MNISDTSNSLKYSVTILSFLDTDGLFKYQAVVPGFDLGLLIKDTETECLLAAQLRMCTKYFPKVTSVKTYAQELTLETAERILSHVTKQTL